MASAPSQLSGTVSVSVDRLQRLEACKARVGVHIELLQQQIAETDAILQRELVRGENHAEALMHVARTDTRDEKSTRPLSASRTRSQRNWRTKTRR
jgi:hypothetical protein